MGRLSDVLLVIEGGGSKGRAAIASNGKILARAVPAGLNPNDVDRDLLRDRFESLILPLLAQCSVGFPCLTTPIGSLRVLAALAGAGRPEPRQASAHALRKVLKPHCSHLRLKVTSDAEALLERFFARGTGVVLIAGTGSICLGVSHAWGSSRTARVGGWGSFLDKGCGFSLGLGVLDAALGALDGKGPPTLAVDLLCASHGLKLDQVPDRFLPLRRGVVAELARVALAASERGDPGARRLVRQAVSDLVEMVRAVAVRLGLAGTFELAVSGGLFDNPRFSKSFGRLLKRKMASASVIHVADPLACLVPSCD